MKAETLPEVDRRALKVLFDTYWAAGGWRDEADRSTSPSDFKYAKQAGMMFDDIRCSHDDIVKRAKAAVRGLKPKDVAAAFVVSLTSQRLDMRSALGSYACLQHFPSHKSGKSRDMCDVCGEYPGPAEKEDLNILNFERFKWGGVRHDNPLYASFDLEQFRALPRVHPTPSDVAVLKDLFKAIEKAPRSTSSAQLQKNLGTAFKSSKAERDVVIGILGYCGIIATTEHPGYLHRFVPESEREIPTRRFVDMPYPACWWQRKDGLNKDAIDFWFGEFL